MKAKKNKDLEIELVNDLLEEAGSLPLPTDEKSATTLDENSNVLDLKNAASKLADAFGEKSSPPSRAQTPAPPPAAPADKTAVLSSGPAAKKEEVVDATVRLSESKVLPSALVVPHDPTRSSLNFGNTQRTAVDKLAIRSAGSGAEAALTLSENVRVAQQRIFELEQEIERLRVENEQLAAAGETIRKSADELQADNEIKHNKLSDLKERFESEREILDNSLKAKDRELKELQLKNQEFEMRLSTNLQKIRVRERELENRLELVKMESTAVVRSKDELILDLKRQMDQISNELENYRAKGQELNRQLGEKQERIRRTVKALRLALGLLEGGSDDEDGGKKVGA